MTLEFIGYSLALIFFCGISDILSVIWTKSVADENKLSIVFASLLISFSSSISIVTIGQDVKYIIPNTIGHGLGSYLGLIYGTKFVSYFKKRDL